MCLSFEIICGLAWLIDDGGVGRMYGWAKFVLLVLPVLIILASVAVYYITAPKGVRA